MQAELVSDCRNIHGEGVLWNPMDGRVWWSDIHGRALWWYDPSSKVSGKRDMPRRLCAFAPRSVGGFVMAFAEQVELWSADFQSEATVHIFEPDNKDTRLNDGCTDREGRFIVGGMNERTGEANSSVIRIDGDCRVEELLRGVSCSNSTCFSPNGATMYFADTPEKTIRAYDYSANQLGPARVLADLVSEPGFPDGSCVDVEGGVWNAEWQGSQVVRIGADGSITHRIALPVSKVTCCAFGGADLSTLYITTSRLMSSPEEVASSPLSGSLFAIRPGLVGVRDVPFAG